MVQTEDGLVQFGAIAFKYFVFTEFGAAVKLTL